MDQPISESASDLIVLITKLETTNFPIHWLKKRKSFCTIQNKVLKIFNMLTPLLKWNQIVGSIRNGFKSLKDSWDRNCHEAELDYLLSKCEHTDFNIVDWEGWYPLHRAIMLANIEILKKLLVMATFWIVKNYRQKNLAQVFCKI